MSAVGMLGFTETEIGWIPTDWSIQSVASMSNVDSESLSNKTAADFTFRYISLGDVDAGKLIGGHSLITFAEAPSRARRIVKSGDILFATVRPNLKGHFFARRVDGNVVASTGFAVIRAKAGVASPAFLYQSLLSGSVDAQIEKLTVGSNYPAVNSADVKGLLLPAPPLPEQQKIAAILTAVDDKLDVIARQIEATQTLKQGLMQTLFSRGVGTKDADGRWVPHAEFKDSELGEIPATWVATTLGAVCDGVLQTGPFGSQLHADEYQHEGVPVLMPKDLVGCRARLATAARISPTRAEELSKHKVIVGDLLFSRRGDVARFALIDEESEGALCGTGCLKARPSATHSSAFLAQLLQLDVVRAWLEQNAVGQTMPNMNTGILSSLPLVVPVDRREQDEIASILDSIDSKLQVLAVKQSHFEELKRGLMQKLLTGEWRVNVDVSTTGT
jgi:type I restriction enzyme S subunit